MFKDVSLWCSLPCQLYHRRYGNAEDQSCKGIATQDGVSENNEVYQLMSYWGAHVVSLGVSMEFGPEFKMLIKQPLFSDTTTSSNTILFHSLELRKLVSVSPLNLTTMVKVIQTSSRQGRERSFSTSFFPKKRILRPTFLTRGATESVPFCVLHSNPYTDFHQAVTLKSVSFFLERTPYSMLGRALPSTFSITERVFQRSDVQASQATHFLQSPILAEDQIGSKSINLEALLSMIQTN
ncbi:hypothetical protein Rs2_09406 [Raphanus sativus]|nr:hypothetical protein Rs2_09406 [Raphanus sativus]